MNENQEPVRDSGMPDVPDLIQEISVNPQKAIPVKEYKRIRISTKLLVFTVSLVALAVFSRGIIAVNLGAAALTNQADADAREYATQGAAHVGAIITGNLATLSEVATLDQVSSMEWNNQVSTISDDVDRLGYQDIAIMNLAGHAKYVKGGGEFDSWGEYANVITGFNQTLDAVIEPIQAASIALDELAKGNLSVMMDGDYKGQHGKIKEDMNRTIDFLKNYVEEITNNLQRIGKGDLSQEIKTYYHGDFVAIKLTINGITTHLSKVMQEIDDAAGQVETGAIQISDGGQALSQGTTEQASSIQEPTPSKPVSPASSSEPRIVLDDFENDKY